MGLLNSILAQTFLDKGESIFFCMKGHVFFKEGVIYA